MKKYYTLHNVVDTRTEQFHSVAVVSEKNLRYFVKKVDIPKDEQGNIVLVPVEAQE